MTVWLARFRSEQESYFDVKGRFAEDETVGGKLQRLARPFETEYLLSASARSYYIRLRNSDCRQQCEHQRDRMGRYEPDDDPLACVPY